jgi:hypothetical protein
MRERNILLPTGDYLRQLIGQVNVKQTDLRAITRRRGIFSSSNDKKSLGPVLIKTGLSPYEYEEIKEAYKEKEDNPKSKTRSISWSSESTLFDSLPEYVDYDTLLNDQFGVCKLVNPPDFVAEHSDPNHVVLDFEISRDDLTKNWGENTTYHKGRVEFKKQDGEMDVSLSLTHTAKETRDFANRLADEMISHFKKEGHIPQDEKIKSINFSDFDNEGRVNFLSDLTQKVLHSVLSFNDTKDIHFSPDPTKSNPPDELKWMKDKIEDLKLKGKELHSTFFVKEKSYHSFIQLFGLTCHYEYKCSGHSGNCKILFEFSDRGDVTNESELTLNITMIKLDINDVGISKTRAKKEILDSLEKYKMEAYQLHKLKET